jgi:hypothetical protein
VVVGGIFLIYLFILEQECLVYFNRKFNKNFSIKQNYLWNYDGNHFHRVLTK